MRVHNQRSPEARRAELDRRERERVNERLALAPSERTRAARQLAELAELFDSDPEDPM